MFTQLPEDQLEAFLDKADTEFVDNIQRMHQMYRLPVTEKPMLTNLTKPSGQHELASVRIAGFLQTLADEVYEGKEIQVFSKMLEDGTDPLTESDEADLVDPATTPEHVKYLKFKQLLASGQTTECERVILTMISDWLADITVYVRSEAMKFGIPLEIVQHIVMASNFTKLPSDGVLRHDENGKFLKDMTNYQPPEDAIYSTIFNPELYEDAGTAEDEYDFEDSSLDDGEAADDES